MSTMSIKKFGAKIGLYFSFDTVFCILKLNQMDYQMYLENLFGAENLTKFSLEFLGIFYASRYFFQFFYRFFGIFSKWPDPVNRMGSVDRICEYLFFSLESRFKSFLFSSNSLPFRFRPPSELSPSFFNS